LDLFRRVIFFWYRKSSFRGLRVANCWTACD